MRVRALGNSEGLISTPVLFPSGTHVTVRVVLERSRCLITDDGAAFAEADMMGAIPTFRRAAREIANEFGIRFNNFEIFEADAALENAAGFIAIVADASRRAIERTAERIAERLNFEVKASVYDRLVDVFGVERVSEDVELSGASTHAWTVDALVRTERSEIVVALASPAPNSVSSTYIKLDDIRRLDGGPRTVAALTMRSSFKADQIAILGRTAKLIDIDAEPAEFRRLAA